MPIKHKELIMAKEKIFTDEQIWNMFEKKRDKVNILFEALDFMQQYNGRSKTQCIGLAMGLEYENMLSCQ